MQRDHYQLLLCMVVLAGLFCTAPIYGQEGTDDNHAASVASVRLLSSTLQFSRAGEDFLAALNSLVMLELTEDTLLAQLAHQELHRLLTDASGKIEAQVGLHRVYIKSHLSQPLLMNLSRILEKGEYFGENAKLLGGILIRQGLCSLPQTLPDQNSTTAWHDLMRFLRLLSRHSSNDGVVLAARVLVNTWRQRTGDWLFVAAHQQLAAALQQHVVTPLNTEPQNNLGQDWVAIVRDSHDPLQRLEAMWRLDAMQVLDPRWCNLLSSTVIFEFIESIGNQPATIALIKFVEHCYQRLENVSSKLRRLAIWRVRIEHRLQAAPLSTTMIAPNHHATPSNLALHQQLQSLMTTLTSMTNHEEFMRVLKTLIALHINHTLLQTLQTSTDESLLQRCLQARNLLRLLLRRYPNVDNILIHLHEEDRQLLGHLQDWVIATAPLADAAWVSLVLIAEDVHSPQQQPAQAWLSLHQADLTIPLLRATKQIQGNATLTTLFAVTLLRAAQPNHTSQGHGTIISRGSKALIALLQSPTIPVFMARAVLNTINAWLPDIRANAQMRLAQEQGVFQNLQQPKNPLYDLVEELVAKLNQQQPQSSIDDEAKQTMLQNLAVQLGDMARLAMHLVWQDPGRFGDLLLCIYEAAARLILESKTDQSIAMRFLSAAELKTPQAISHFYLVVFNSGRLSLPQAKQLSRYLQLQHIESLLQSQTAQLLDAHDIVTTLAATLRPQHPASSITDVSLADTLRSLTELRTTWASHATGRVSPDLLQVVKTLPLLH